MERRRGFACRGIAGRVPGGDRMNDAAKCLIGAAEISAILVILFFLIPAIYSAFMIIYEYMIPNTIHVWEEMLGGLI